MNLPRPPQAQHAVDSSAEWLASLVDPETTASRTGRLLAPKLANGKTTKQSALSSRVAGVVVSANGARWRGGGIGSGIVRVYIRLQWLRLSSVSVSPPAAPN